jgi:hypothetical protein
MQAATFRKFPPVIAGFRRKVNENRDLKGYYAVNTGNSLPTFQSRNVAKELPILGE